MKSRIIISVVLISVCIFILVFAWKKSKEQQQENIETTLTLCEYAYMEGQKDYMNGDVRIKEDMGEYYWVKSPWDEGREPSYQKHSLYIPNLAIHE